MNEVKRSYYAIIPASVRYDNELAPNAKLLFGEITALCSEKGFCWASNDYFEQLYGVGKRTVQRWIDSLVDRGYLLRCFRYSETGALLGRCLSVTSALPDGGMTFDDVGVTKMSYGYDKNVIGGMTKMSPIIIQDNNTINLKKNKQKKSDEIAIEEYTQNEELKAALRAFIEMRFKIGKPLTDYALKLRLQDLDKLTSNEDMKIKIVNQSVGGCWQDFYPLKGEVTSNIENCKRTYTADQINAMFLNIDEEDI